MRAALVVVTLALLAPGAAALGPVAGPDDGQATAQAAASCAPPCGEINPRILFTFEDISREPLDMTQGSSQTFEGTVTFWFDADDEGYVPQDPQEQIEIMFSFPRLPTWAQMTIEPNTLQVDPACPTCFVVNTDDPAQPTFHYEQTFDVTLTLEVTGQPEATPGYDYGKLQLFAKSSESGIYNPGYGIKEVRIDPAGTDALETNNTDETPLPGVLALIGVLSTVAAVAGWRRLR